MVSTTDCESFGTGSIPVRYPILNAILDRYGDGVACKAIVLRGQLGSIPRCRTILVTLKLLHFAESF